MAEPDTFRTIYIKIGDGASPETFTHDCTINADRGIQFQSQGQDVFVPDCADPEAAGWRQHFKTGLSATITGSGMADAGSVAAMDTWWRGQAAKNVQVFLNDDTVAKGVWTGAFKLTDIQWSGNPADGNPVQFTCTMQSHGIIQPYDTTP